MITQRGYSPVKRAVVVDYVALGGQSNSMFCSVPFGQVLLPDSARS